jgi:hypothetical protein
MTVPIIPGSEWGRQFKSTPPRVGSVTAMTVHYTGARNFMASAEQIPARLRSMQAADLAKPNMSAVKYNFAVDKYGRIWELRGFEFRNAADGRAETNTESFSVNVLVGVEDNQPTPKIVEALQSLYQHAVARFGRQLTVRCHKDVRSTSCPGVLLEGLVRSGRIQRGVTPAPEPVPHPVNEVGDDMIAIYKPVYRGAGPATPWVAVFGSGAVRRAVNADVRLAERLRLPVIDQDSEEQHNYLVGLFPN